jgi:hypothetical protein
MKSRDIVACRPEVNLSNRQFGSGFHTFFIGNSSQMAEESSKAIAKR